MDYKTQAQTALKGINDLGIMADAARAYKTGDFSGLAYIIGMGMGTREPIKYGLIFAVGDALEAA
jgi:hypothetical protein